MNAFPIRESACPSCGGELPPRARFCSRCGVSVDSLPPGETLHGPVARERVERRWFGVPARFLLLWVGFAALGAAAGLFATGSWAWGAVAVAVAVSLLALLGEAARRHGGVFVERSSQLAAEGRAQASSTAEIWRTRFDTKLAQWQTSSQLEQVERERAPVLEKLGEAVWRQDADAEAEARRRLEELDEQRQRVEDELSERLAGAEERIRVARIPVQDTMMVAPTKAGNAPYPPPGEADPPQPAQVPEPYPPPDEGTPPTPAPDPAQDE